MTVYHYDHAVLTLDGKPIATADLGMVLDREPAEPFVTPPNCTVAATFRGTGSIGAFLDLAPSKPQPVNVTMTWGILGPITFPAWAADATMRQTPGGMSAEMGMVPDERALRRAVSMAVQKAIMERAVRSGVHARAMSAGAELWRLSGVVLRKRGERKKRRAMRRLLRAAGVLGEK